MSIMDEKKYLQLDMSVKDIKGVGEKYYSIFKNSGIETIYDLLINFPVYYIDFSKTEKEIVDYKGVYGAKIIGVNLNRNYRRRLSVLRVKALILEKNIEIVFFNKPYLKENLVKNEIIYVYGLIEMTKGKYSMVNPVLSLNSSGNIISVYKNIRSIKSGIVKKIVCNALETLEVFKEPLPDLIVNKHGFSDIKTSLLKIHRPFELSEKIINEYKTRFKYNEFLVFQLELQYIRKLLKSKIRVFEYKLDIGLKRDIEKRLEFSLTDSQNNVFEEIKCALTKSYGMAGLLQGDVGSGKTIIAFLSILIAVYSGYQSAVLVPTEVLANQHFKIAEEFFKGYKVRILTGNTAGDNRKKIISDLADGNIDIIIGTHSILNEGIRFKNLAMIVIDEQHKFGVAQRASLFYKSKGVDLLVMTATPIPRTMLLSAYKDLKVFSIKDKPVGRKPIKTKIIPVAEREKFYLWLSEKIKEGEKAYIILPLIEKSEFFSELHSIEEEKKFIKDVFSPYKIGVITGKTEMEERDKALMGFKNGNLKVILATTVIEVGIDVKDATVIVIEDADRYGLAALHQLRGRVGRGEKLSYCYLIPSKRITGNGKKRLLTIERENDGFKIAEIDLEMRGGGLITGLNQSGIVNFKTGDILNDYKIFQEAKNDASNILENKQMQTDYIKEQINRIKKKSFLLNFS